MKSFVLNSTSVALAHPADPDDLNVPAHLRRSFPVLTIFHYNTPVLVSGREALRLAIDAALGPAV